MNPTPATDVYPVSPNLTATVAVTVTVTLTLTVTVIGVRRFVNFQIFPSSSPMVSSSLVNPSSPCTSTGIYITPISSKMEPSGFRGVSTKNHPTGWRISKELDHRAEPPPPSGRLSCITTCRLPPLFVTLKNIAFST